MKHLYKFIAIAGLATGMHSGAANAAYILDTGVPTGSGFSLALDQTDFVAAEFSLGAGQTISSIQGYLTAGLSNPGDTFSISLYSGSELPDSRAIPLWSSQAAYQADGWNGLSNLSVSNLAAGNYWVAFEVGGADSASGLLMTNGAPNTGAAAALAFAFNSGNGYQALTGDDFGVQVSTVPLPGALLFLSSGLLGLGALRRKNLSATA